MTTIVCMDGTVIEGYGRNAAEAPVPSRQEMFNRAYLGLKSQGFNQCMIDGTCVYNGPNGQHCAWGWVDTVPDRHNGVSVGTLAFRGIGLAARLSLDDLNWADKLQACHDQAFDARAVKVRLETFAAKCDLTIPEGP